ERRADLVVGDLQSCRVLPAFGSLHYLCQPEAAGGHLPVFQCSRSPDNRVGKGCDADVPVESRRDALHGQILEGDQLLSLLVVVHGVGTGFALELDMQGWLQGTWHES